MGKVLEVESKDVLREYIKEKNKKKQINIYFGEFDKKDKEEQFQYINELKFNLFEKTKIECVEKNRRDNVKKKIKRIVEENDFKSNEEIKKLLDDNTFFKKYKTLDYIRDSGMVVVTKEEQLKNEVFIDELINFILVNFDRKINFYMKKEKKEEIKKLYEFSIQKGIKAKIIFY